MSTPTTTPGAIPAPQAWEDSPTDVRPDFVKGMRERTALSIGSGNYTLATGARTTVTNMVVPVVLGGGGREGTGAYGFPSSITVATTSSVSGVRITLAADPEGSQVYASTGSVALTGAMVRVPFVGQRHRIAPGAQAYLIFSKVTSRFYTADQGDLYDDLGAAQPMPASPRDLGGQRVPWLRLSIDESYNQSIGLLREGILDSPVALPSLLPYSTTAADIAAMAPTPASVGIPAFYFRAVGAGESAGWEAWALYQHNQGGLVVLASPHPDVIVQHFSIGDPSPSRPVVLDDLSFLAPRSPGVVQVDAAPYWVRLFLPYQPTKTVPLAYTEPLAPAYDATTLAAYRPSATLRWLPPTSDGGADLSGYTVHTLLPSGQVQRQSTDAAARSSTVSAPVGSVVWLTADNGAGASEPALMQRLF